MLCLKLVQLVEMSSNETYHKACKYLSDVFIQNGLKQAHNLSPFLFNYGLKYAIRKFQTPRRDWN
jgi:hypothetical protein